MNTPQPSQKQIIKMGSIAAIGIVLLATILMIGCPNYTVYTSEKQGQAMLAHAQYSKEVAVAEAKAKMESATMLAQADTIRAHGVARSNEIIGQSLNNNEAYLKWLWIDQLEKNNQAVIYVPTEANMPIMEATRFNRVKNWPALEQASSIDTIK